METLIFNPLIYKTVYPLLNNITYENKKILSDIFILVRLPLAFQETNY